MGNSLFKNWGRKEARVLFLGLDAAGKTTAMYRLKLGEVVTTIPTIGFNVETLVHKHVQITAWDVGGRDKVRPLMRHYFPNTHGLIYVIDSSDKERFDQALDELLRFVSEDELRGIPLAVMANKQDLPDAMEPVEIFSKLLGTKQMDDRDWAVFGVTCITGEGLFECMDWLANVISKNPSKSGTEMHQVARVYDYKESTGTNNNGPGLDSKDVSSSSVSKDPPKISYFTNMIQAFRKIFV